MVAESNLEQIQVKQVVEADQIKLAPVPVPPKKPFADEPDNKEEENALAP